MQLNRICRHLIIQVNRGNFLKQNFKIRIQSFHDEFTSNNPLEIKKNEKNEENKNIPGALKNKFKIYRDPDSTPIFDVEEEKQLLQQEEFEETNLDTDQYLGINLNRGVRGVFEIEDLIEVLRHENAGEIFVCSVPKELKYVDHMCVVTGRSYRHMTAIAEFVRRIFKMKRHDKDILPRIEGKTSKDWMALDLGNIALHIFSPSSRKIYDLESLWALGSEFDKEYNKPTDPLIKLFEDHSTYFDYLKPKQQKV